MRICPESALRRPIANRSNNDFPEPETPVKRIVSACSSLKLTSSRTTRSSKLRKTWRNSMAGTCAFMPKKGSNERAVGQNRDPLTNARVSLREISTDLRNTAQRLSHSSQKPNKRLVVRVVHCPSAGFRPEVGGCAMKILLAVDG